MLKANLANKWQGQSSFIRWGKKCGKVLISCSLATSWALIKVLTHPLFRRKVPCRSSPGKYSFWEGLSLITEELLIWFIYWVCRWICLYMYLSENTPENPSLLSASSRSYFGICQTNPKKGKPTWGAPPEGSVVTLYDIIYGYLSLKL